ncbi:MAG TPA: MBL fold metallo-hydrolase [Desulfosalsimonadaceae bacterium]|nr:MBL fold metallo-hydrolase [Desulfosalsimonadaceae bacterium]
MPQPLQPFPSTADCLPESSLSLCLLASGSKGNAIYVSSGNTRILIDAGLSGAEMERRFRSRQILPQDLDALVVTHEHSDHLQGVGVLARKYGIPVYISPATYREAEKKMGRISGITHFSCGSGFCIQDIRLHPFSTAHDASDPAGFTLQANGKKIGIATDLGVATAMVRHHLSDCTCLVLEANHDQRMLEDGPYPWPIKQRIKGRTGHLSNEAARDLLRCICHHNLTHVILGHISETNNRPDKALAVVSEGLLQNMAPRFTVALQHAPAPLIAL